MHSSTRRVLSFICLAVFAVSALAQSRAVPATAPGGMTREEMYAQLFREIAGFESAADRLDQQDRSSANLRDHYRKWLRLSPASDAQLRRIALAAVRDLDADSPSGITDVSNLTARDRDRVQQALESLATAFGPAEFAYLDSMVRQYTAAVVVPSEGVATMSLGCPTCTYPEGESTTAQPYVILGSCNGSPCIAGEFAMLLQPNGSSYSGRTVAEQLSGEVDTCYLTTYEPQYPPLTLGQPSSWQVGSAGDYGPDYIGVPLEWVEYYQQSMEEDNTMVGCGESATQTMLIECPDLSLQEYETHSVGTTSLYPSYITFSRDNAFVTGAYPQ